MPKNNAMENLKRRTGLSDNALRNKLEDMNVISFDNLRNIDPRRLVLINKKLYNSHGLVNYVQSSTNPKIPHTMRAFTKKQKSKISRQARLTGHPRPKLKPETEYKTFTPLRPTEYDDKVKLIIQVYRLLGHLVKTLFKKRSNRVIPHETFEAFIHVIAPGYTENGGQYLRYPPVTKHLMNLMSILLLETVDIVNALVESNRPSSVTGETVLMISNAVKAQTAMLSKPWDEAISNALESGIHGLMSLDPSTQNPYNPIALMKFALRNGWTPGAAHATKVMEILLYELVHMYHIEGRTDRSLTTMLRMMVQGRRRQDTSGVDPLTPATYEFSIPGGPISAISHLVTMYLSGSEDSAIRPGGTEKQRRLRETIGQTMTRTFSSASFVNSMKAIRTGYRGTTSATLFDAKLRAFRRDIKEIFSLYLPVSRSSRNSNILYEHVSNRGGRALRREIDLAARKFLS